MISYLMCLCHCLSSWSCYWDSLKFLGILFFLTAESCFLVWTDTLVKSSPIRRYLEYFQFGEGRKKATVNINSWFFFSVDMFSFSWLYTQKWNCWFGAISTFNHWNNLTHLLSKAGKLFEPSISSMLYEASNFSPSLSALNMICYHHHSHHYLSRCKVVVTYISLLSSDDEYFLCFLAIYITSLDTANGCSGKKSPFFFRNEHCNRWS